MLNHIGITFLDVFITLSWFLPVQSELVFWIAFDARKLRNLVYNSKETFQYQGTYTL